MNDIVIPDPPGGRSDPHELRILRKQTKEFISHNTLSVALQRKTAATSDGAGGKTKTPSTLLPQDFRLIIQGGNVSSRNMDGEETPTTYVLLGEWDADVAKGDVFTMDDRDYRIDFVREDRRYETWCEVVHIG